MDFNATLKTASEAIKNEIIAKIEALGADATASEAAQAARGVDPMGINAVKDAVKKAEDDTAVLTKKAADDASQAFRKEI